MTVCIQDAALAPARQGFCVPDGGWGADGCKYDAPMANYHDYTDRNAPGWCVPLAALLFKFGDAPFIYVACAFGWLTRGLIEMGAEAYCIDWSPWTTRRAGHDLWPLPN